MIDYSLARSRFIGMIQKNNNSDLYKIGCIGKIHSFSETNDGRYLISLQGTSCFKVIKEIEKKYNFRIVDAEVLSNNENIDFLNDNQKVNLIKKNKQYINIKNINMNLEEIEKIEFSQIIKFIAMVSPFKDEDKQVLLELKTWVIFIINYYRLLNLSL